MSRSPQNARHVVALAPALVALTATCLPNLGPSDALIASTRILAVRADPAEAAPGTLVTFAALVVDPHGTVTGADIAWSFCSARKPLTEDNVVSSACLYASSTVTAGRGATIAAKTPSDACSIFGPDVPSSGRRPRDPDSTGGYYQPLRADLTGADTTFELARVSCALADASAAAASAFAASYTLNENPRLLPLTATVDGEPADLSAVPAGVRLALTVGWPDASAETFAYFDPASQTVTTQRESMQVAWYTSAGALDTESTGRASDDLTTTTENGWTAPRTTGIFHLWVVLRDSRGGVDFSESELAVVP
jgi:hypothetical protein